jgi:hypothetical protein
VARDVRYRSDSKLRDFSWDAGIRKRALIVLSGDRRKTAGVQSRRVARQPCSRGTEHEGHAKLREFLLGHGCLFRCEVITRVTCTDDSKLREFACIGRTACSTERSKLRDFLLGTGGVHFFSAPMNRRKPRKTAGV